MYYFKLATRGSHFTKILNLQYSQHVKNVQSKTSYRTSKLRLACCSTTLTFIHMSAISKGLKNEQNS